MTGTTTIMRTVEDATSMSVDVAMDPRWDTVVNGTIAAAVVSTTM